MKVLLVNDRSSHVAMLREELGRGCDVLAVLDATPALARSAADYAVDVTVIGAVSPQPETLEHVAALWRAAPRPIVLFTDDPDPDRERIQQAIRAGVSGYVVAGLAPARLLPMLHVALARFEADAQLRAELESTRSKLAERKRIEKAKGILMQARGLAEEEAYGEMRKLAMDRKQKLVDIAERIIEAKRLLSVSP
ncbi:MAG TPA: ANTAR domain-containing protein [Burkholderiaceae bacterium]|nr:ANTAR domain-containing protein [Burkholderiaceae bacterium]